MFRIEISPNGVEHLVIDGKCATCGNVHDWVPIKHSQIAAARVQVAIRERRGEEIPPEIQRLADMKIQ